MAGSFCFHKRLFPFLTKPVWLGFVLNVECALNWLHSNAASESRRQIDKGGKTPSLVRKIRILYFRSLPLAV
jgi:hypothetical protein